MALELYTISGSPYGWRIQLALEHKGIAYELRSLSRSTGELQQPAYLALNPRGRVPTLVDDGFVLPESLAILAYVEARWPDPPLLGSSPRETGTIWRAIAEYTSYVDRAVEDFILPIYFDRVATEADGIRAAIATLAGELARYDAHLARTPYLAGDAMTAADLVVLPHLQSILRAASKDAARAFALPFVPLATAHPALAAWRDRMMALPYYARTVPPHWR